MRNPNKPVGWRREPVRHGLAAKGISTTSPKSEAMSKVPAKREHPFAEKSGFDSQFLRDFEKEYGKITGVLDGDERGMILEVGGAEYLVFNSYDDAERAAISQVENDLEDEPELFSKDFIKDHTSLSETDRRIIANEEADDYVENIADEDDGERVCDEAGYNEEFCDIGDRISKEEDDARIETLEENREKLVEKAKEELREKLSEENYKALEDPYRYFVEEQGIFSAEDFFKQFPNAIDVKEAAQEAVNIDGVAHFLAGYDGDEIEFKGKYMYRVN